MSSCPYFLISRWALIAGLNEEEQRSLRELVSPPPVTFARGRDLLRPDELVERAYVVSDGWAMWHEMLPDGSRQVFDFCLPGDIIGLEAMVMEHELLQRGVSIADAAVNQLTVSALTNVVAIPVKRSALAALLHRHPGFGFLMLTLIAQRRSARFRRHLINFGRRSARAATADLLLELWERQRVIGRADDRAFALPVTQSELGDALGIASAYLSRILAELDRQHVLTFSRNGHRMVTVHDPARLRRIVEDDEGAPES